MKKKLLVDWITFTVDFESFMSDFVFPTAGVSPESEKEGDFLDRALLAAHYKDEVILENVLSFLGLPDSLSFQPQRPIWGYASFYRYDGIWIGWGGCNTIVVNISGGGCRLMETLIPDLDWHKLICKVMAMKRYNFSRLDIACDTQGTEGLKMNHLIRYALHGRYVSRWKSTPRVVQGREETIDFGSPKSRFMLRIYNKTLERKCSIDEEVEVPENWVRCEIQLRNDAVDSFLREWRNSGDISSVYFGLMANHLKFVKEKASNYSRNEVVKWWRDFLDNAEPIKLLYKGGLDYNLESLNRYVIGQAGSSIHTWFKAYDWDMDRLKDLVTSRQLNDRQQSLLQRLSGSDSE